MIKIGKQIFDTDKKTYLMGILNVTPDSFSDGGCYDDLDRALYRAQEMVREGADILDVGGESTRPGHVRITDEEETARILPVIEGLKREFDVPVSVDTYKSSVARAALLAGADLVNDIWGLKHDRDLARIVASSQASCCLMHNRMKPEYTDFMEEVKQELLESVEIAVQNGIKKERIILDPGVGFAKTYENNLEVMYRLEQISALGFPVLLGASRKSVVGLALDLPAAQRLEGTLVTTVMAVLKGCAFVRVHDVKENARAIRMAEAIRDGWRQE